MISLTQWLYIIKTLLKSNLKTSDIREVILSKCLLSPRKFMGCYQVDTDKVWEFIISQDMNCVSKMEELYIKDAFGVISYYQEVEYKKMRGTYPRNHHKKGR